ncbi:MAG: MFS transporter [Thermoleophilia bacterium]|nr:MFS transporter [Thermoleophilia bacterium]
MVQADRWAMPAFLPLMARDFGKTVPSLGVIVVAYLLPYGLLQLVYGPVADRFGERRVIETACGLMSAGILLSALAPSFGLLVLARGITGVGAAGVPPLGISLLNDLVPRLQRARSLSRYMSISFMGQLLSMLVGATVAGIVGWRPVLFAYGLLSFVTLLDLYRSLAVARGIEAPGHRHGFLWSYSELLRSPGARTLFPAIALEGFLINGLFSFLGGFFSEEIGLSSLNIALILSMFGIAAVAIGPLTKFLWSTLPLGRSTAAAALIGAAAAALYLFPPSSALVNLPATFLLGFSFILGHNAFLSAAGNMGRGARSTSMAMVALCFMGGGALGVQAASWIISHWSYRVLFAVWSVATLASALGYMKTLDQDPRMEATPGVAGGTDDPG